MQAESSDDMLGPKKLNYDFLLLVRDKKYAQALTLGRKILQANPDNPSVQKFCSFIEKNNTEIIKMVERQKEEEQYESADSDQDEENEQEEGVEGQQKQEESDKESESNDDEEEEEEMEEEEPEKTEKKEKIQLTTCTLNQIPHICPRHHRQKVETSETLLTKGSEQGTKK